MHISFSPVRLYFISTFLKLKCDMQQLQEQLALVVDPDMQVTKVSTQCSPLAGHEFESFLMIAMHSGS